MRMKVDLPDPDGPKMTTTSPRLTVMLTSRTAQKSPNHLWTFSQTMMSSRCSRGRARMPSLSSGIAMGSFDRLVSAMIDLPGGPFSVGPRQACAQCAD